MICYRKQIARQHSWSTLQKFSSHPVWSPWKIWFLFLLPCEVPIMLGTRCPPWDERRGWPLEIRYSPVKFRRSGSNDLGVGRVPQNFGDAGASPFVTGVWPTPRNMFLLHLCYLPSFRSLSNKTSVIMEIRQKIDLSCPAFRGHSRSVEPTRIDRLPMTSY